MQTHSNQDLRNAVQPARVNRRLYTDPAIFELEMERIFGVAWIYVGHESQVTQSRRLFLHADRPQADRGRARRRDGRLHVLHNQCAHRGAMVVASDRGHADEFQCCYHGWTYHLDGRLKAVPLQHGYPPDFDPKSPRPWRCCRYRG